MRFTGRVYKDGKWWLIESPALDVVTQGRTKKEAYAMLKDAIEALTNKAGFEATVFPGEGEYLEVGSNDPNTFLALFLRRQRESRSVSLAEAAQRLGAKSRNAYARYEQGQSVPTTEQLERLLFAVTGGNDFVIGPARVQ